MNNRDADQLIEALHIIAFMLGFIAFFMAISTLHSCVKL